MYCARRKSASENDIFGADHAALTASLRLRAHCIQSGTGVPPQFDASVDLVCPRRPSNSGGTPVPLLTIAPLDQKPVARITMFEAYQGEAARDARAM